MNSEKDGQAVSHLLDVLPEMLEYAADEWRSRTYWGKVTYPLWFIKSTVEWAVLILILGSVHAVNEYNRALDESWEAVKETTPATYKEGETDDA